MARICSFPPVAARGARVLVLGSMPGEASLAAGQYYAHPRNAFWPIMGALFGAEPTLAYPRRIERLTTAGIALWDVLASCRREGSLDTAIDPASIDANPIGDLLSTYPGIRHIFFNGSMAADSFRRYVQPRLDITSFGLRRLPSTSPAHAGRSMQQKLEIWRSAFAEAGLLPA